MIEEQIYLCKGLALDLTRGCLAREGKPVHLRPQTYEVLKYLVEHKGRLISKDKLIEEIWHGRAVTDGSLGKCIEEVRVALGPGARQYVRNVRGRGYIFEPEVVEKDSTLSVRSERIDVVQVIADEADLSTLGQCAHERDQTISPPNDWSLKQQDFVPNLGPALDRSSTGYWITGVKRHKLMLFLVSFALIIVTVLGTFDYYKYSTDHSRTITSIAVLPFANSSDDPSMEYLSDGISEGIINSISQLPGLRVMSRNSVFRYKGNEIDARTAGRDLSVQAVLTGQVRQQGEMLSVSVELVNAVDNSHIWGELYSRKITDLVSLQGEIARDVSRKLHARLSGVDEKKLSKNYPESVEAYQFYLRGRYHKAKLTEHEIRKSISFYEKAIDADRTYALAYAGIADAYRTLVIGGYVPSQEAFPQAKAAASLALEIDPDLTEAHVVLGWIGFWFDWNWNEAENRLKNAIVLSPNSSDAHRAYAHLLSNLGRHDEAILEIRRARELDPLLLINLALEGQFFFYAGHDEEAYAKFQETLEIEPEFWIAYNGMGRVFIWREKYSEAITALRKAKELSSNSTEPITQLGYALAKAGRHKEARATLEELRSMAVKNYVPAYNFAMIHNGLGEKEEALKHLEKSLQDREVQITFIKIDKRWDQLRGDPHFQKLMRVVGFDQ